MIENAAALYTFFCLVCRYWARAALCGDISFWSDQEPKRMQKSTDNTFLAVVLTLMSLVLFDLMGLIIK